MEYKGIFDHPNSETSSHLDNPSYSALMSLWSRIVEAPRNLTSIYNAGQGNADRPRPKIRGSIKKGPPPVPRPPVKPQPVTGKRGK